MKKAHRLIVALACGALCVAGEPFIAITTTPQNVTYAVAALAIAGSNNIEVVGTMWWTNLQSGARGTLAATPAWTISGITLRWGPNAIVVYGTNFLGMLAAGSINVYKYNCDGSGQQSGSTFGLRPQGTLVGWGDNTYGETNCPAGSNYVAMTAGRYHAVALRGDSTLAAWGNNAYGQTNCLPGSNYTAVAAGWYHTLALGSNGTVVAWGQNNWGQTNCPGGSDYIAVAAGAVHSLALRGNGNLVGWGSSSSGQTNCPAGNNYVAVAAGWTHSLALRNNGTLVAWGGNTYGQTNCPPGSNYVAIAAGAEHSVALRSDGTLVAWGISIHGETNCPAGSNFVAVAAGFYHSLALRNDGRLVAWGQGTYGETNYPAGAYVAIAAGGYHGFALWQPVPFIAITNADMTIVTYAVTNCTIAGTNNSEVVGTMWWTNLQSSAHGTLAATPSWTISNIALRWGPNAIVVYGTNALGTLAADRVHVFRCNRDGSGQQSGSRYGLRAQGALVSWGHNAYDVTNCPAGNWYAAMAAGFYYSVVLQSNGMLAAWGDNGYGQTNCPAGSNYVAVAAGDAHALALRDDGILVAWGENIYGQNNCPAGSNYVAVAAGMDLSLALRSDGTLIGWGYGAQGQTNCPPGSNHVAIAAGSYHALALRSDGTLVGWGWNIYGQTNCPAGNTYVAVAGGRNHSLALRTDGTLVAWGDNMFGQTNCPAGSNYIAIAAGMYHSLALRSDGTLVGWGYNNYGQTNCPAGVYAMIAAGENHNLALQMPPAPNPPQIATNALLFPTAGSYFTAYAQTNIVWDPARITDAEDGTNLVLTLISLLDARTTNTFSIVTNNVSSVLGQVAWRVPLQPEGQTSYVIRLEVVDSSALTNSRVFWDNVFVVVPEPAVMLLALAIVVRMCPARSAAEQWR
jgi:alpha-tubulin suppressor-like RCC1 family protein